MENRRRLMRSAMTAAAVVLLTIGGHAAGQGSLPSAPGLAIVSVLGFALAYAVSAARPSFVRLLLFVLGAQALLHVILTFTSGHAHSAAGQGAGGMLAGHALAALVASVLLAHADAVADRWVQYLASVIGAPPVATEMPGPDPRGPVLAQPPLASMADALRHQVERRGPPARPAPIPA